MIYRGLDADKDYNFGHNAADMLSGTDAVAQAIYTRLWLWQGQWWEDLENGLPMLQQVLGFRNTKHAADILISACIQETPEVPAIVSFESDYDEITRAYSCSVVVNTTYGVLNLPEVTF